MSLEERYFFSASRIIADDTDFADLGKPFRQVSGNGIDC